MRGAHGAMPREGWPDFFLERRFQVNKETVSNSKDNTYEQRGSYQRRLELHDGCLVGSVPRTDFAHKSSRLRGGVRDPYLSCFVSVECKMTWKHGGYVAEGEDVDTRSCVLYQVTDQWRIFLIFK
jgi:hypothetical protein